MKRRILLLLCCLCSTFTGRAQLVLHPGDVWNCTFSNMTTFVIRVDEINTLAGWMDVNFNSFPSGTLQYELWDWQGGPGAGPVGPYGPPTVTGTITGSGQSSSRAGNFGGLWDFQQGAVRLTMLSGECIVSSIACGSIIPVLQNRNTKYTNSLPLIPPPPRLTLRQTSGSTEVSWWTNDTTGYLLESANALPTNQWSVVPTAPMVVSNRYVVTVGTNESAAYFRLRK